MVKLAFILHLLKCNLKDLLSHHFSGSRTYFGGWGFFFIFNFFFKARAFNKLAILMSRGMLTT